MAELLPVIRMFHPDGSSRVARQFAKLAWPAYALLILTGIWNVIAMDPAKQSNGWHITLYFEIAMALVSGLGALGHGAVKNKKAIGILGAVSALSALAAMFLGVMLAGS